MKYAQFAQAREASGKRTGEVVVPEHQFFQLGEVSQLGRYGAAQISGGECQPLQVGEVSQFGRYGTAQFVVVEKQNFQVCQIAQFRGYGA